MACTPGRVGGRACACARAACSPALGLSLPLNAEPPTHRFNRPISGDLPAVSGGIGLLAPGRAAGLRIWHPARPRLGFPIPIPSARVPRLPDSLQPFPPVSPERGGAFGPPPPANRLSSCRQYARPAATRTRDPARAGAAVGRCHLDVRACQVWGVGVQQRRRSLDDCPPFSLEIWGSVKRRFFG